MTSLAKPLLSSADSSEGLEILEVVVGVADALGATDIGSVVYDG